MEYGHSHHFIDLKSLSLQFVYDTFITFEMPRVAYNRSFWKIYIELLFRPFVQRSLNKIKIPTNSSNSS